MGSGFERKMMMKNVCLLGWVTVWVKPENEYNSWIIKDNNLLNFKIILGWLVIFDDVKVFRKFGGVDNNFLNGVFENV